MRGVSVAVLAGAMVAAATTSAAPAPGPRTERITLSAAGEQIGTGAGGQALSSDGRYAAFVSEDAGVVAGDTNGVTDVFVRDLRRGTVERVNVASDGTQADGGGSYRAEISGDGRYVAFASRAGNLVEWAEPPEPYASDMYVHDRRTGRTERVSVAADGGSGAVLDSFDMSRDGRYVAFTASSARMEGDATDRTLAYVVDRRTGTTKRISDHVPSDWYVPSVTLSADGSRLAYVQRHPRGGRHELWLADLRTGEQDLVNATPEGGPTNGSPAGATLSDDGSLVSYASFDDSVVPGAPTYTWELYLYDSRTGKTRWMTHEGRGGLGAGVLSADGRRLAYTTETPADGGTTVENVHVRDLRTGRTELVTRTTTGGPQSEGYAAPSAFARDGRLLAFHSTSSELVPGDTNGAADGFLRRLG
ncbi:TolB family protein [Streptomyces sp. NPDC007808]|uniref:TolB family protein n=1 Tax=Streptomyces sp. NPDC007808 TaxID=3364779 RepID=UPI0036AF6009